MLTFDIVFYVIFIKDIYTGSQNSTSSRNEVIALAITFMKKIKH